MKDAKESVDMSINRLSKQGMPSITNVVLVADSIWLMMMNENGTRCCQPQGIPNLIRVFDSMWQSTAGPAYSYIFTQISQRTASNIFPVNSNVQVHHNFIHFIDDMYIYIYRPLPKCLVIFSLSHVFQVDLIHWGRVTHICIGNLTIIGSDNDLSPGRRQAIIWTKPIMGYC